jgi:hypothetical protein
MTLRNGSTTDTETEPQQPTPDPGNGLVGLVLWLAGLLGWRG